MSLRTSGIAAAALALAAASAHAQRVVRLPERDRPLGGRITTVFGIGTMEERSWEMLNNAEQAVFDRADNLYVLDRGNARVLVFDRNGRFVRQLGKKGGGPGELEVPTALSILADGSVAVLDMAHQNFTLFGADGAFRRTVPMRPEWGFPGRVLAPEPRGGVLAMLRPGLGMMTPQALRNTRSLPQSQVLSRVSLAGAGSTARLFEIPDNMVAQTRSSGPGQFDFRITGPPEFSPLTLWGVLPNGGVALTHTQLYTVKVLDPGGRIVRWIQRPVRVRRPTERDRERARERVREQMRSGRGMIMVVRGGPGGGGGPAGPPPGPSREQIEQRVRELQFADTVRTIQGMVVTPSGKIWIERTPANIGDPGPIDLVTPDGRYLGTLNGTKLPVAISATGRAVYLERDADDVERVIVRQLPAGWY
ncbi:MAG TPA: 6-bladed beta-propeller [Longimicrobium sp.]